MTARTLEATIFDHLTGSEDGLLVRSPDHVEAVMLMAMSNRENRRPTIELVLQVAGGLSIARGVAADQLLHMLRRCIESGACLEDRGKKFRQFMSGR